MADFFISYTSADRFWAHWVAKELTGLGHSPHIHEWELGGGDDIYAWMEKRVDAADHVLCVISEEYLKAPYSTLERNAALWRAASGTPDFVVLVVVKPVRLPVLSDHLRRCELFGLPEDEARLRFREFIAKRSVPSAVAFPGRAVAVSNISLRVPVHFMGREDALASIETALERDASGPRVVALHGLRGVGKTTLAAAFAEQHRDDYRATWWIRAQNEAGMRADLVALGMRLRWVDAEEKEEPALATVMERLRHEGEGILLIFDNAVDAGSLKRHLPSSGRSTILVTSNAHAWRQIAAPVKIETWSNDVGASYLLARLGSSERPGALALSEALGGLPLAHEQAAAYCERLEKPLGEYHKRFAAAPARLLDDARDAPADYHDHLTVAKTFALALAEAAKLHVAAEPLIAHAALFPPESLPLFLFEEGREKFSEPLASALADDGLDEALGALRAFALIDRETISDERTDGIATETIRLHRLVRQVAGQTYVGERRQRAYSDLVSAVAAAYPHDTSDAKTWPRARRLDGPALALLDSPEAGGAVQHDAARLLDGLAAYRHHAVGTFAEARGLYARALALREKHLGPEHPDTAETLNNLALLLRDEGEAPAARPLLERALAINEKALGPEHASTAASLNNLALLLRDQGELAAARSLFERALASTEKAMGQEHPATAAGLANLGLLLKSEGDRTGARALFERALAIDEKARGADHPDTAIDLGHLGLLLREAGDFTAARPLYERILAIDEAAFGTDHPRTAASLSSLAEVFHQTGDLPSARTLFERALATFETSLPPHHRDIAGCLGNLALLLHDSGELAQARLHYERALAINEKTLGPEHPATATDLNNLATLLLDQREFEKALPLLERALAIKDCADGPDHPHTNRLRFHLARALLATGNAANALELASVAQAAHAAALGPSHPWTLNSAGAKARALAALRGTGASQECLEPANGDGDQARADQGLIDRLPPDGHS